MGTYLQVHKIACFISAAHVEAALAALKTLAATSHLDWISEEQVLRAQRLDEALAACRWSSSVHENGDVSLDYFECEKYGSEDEIFGALSPYMTAGSLIEAEAEGERFRWVFTGKRLLIQSAEIRYPDLPLET